MSDATFAGSCAITEAAQNADRANSATPVVTRIERLIADSPSGLSRVCGVWKRAAETARMGRGRSGDSEPALCAAHTITEPRARQRTRLMCKGIASEISRRVVVRSVYHLHRIASGFRFLNLR